MEHRIESLRPFVEELLKALMHASVFGVECADRNEEDTTGEKQDPDG
jgi:hypothetical protein